MANIACEVSEEAYRRAKVAAATEGLMLKAWIEKIIMEATKPLKASK